MALLALIQKFPRLASEELLNRMKLEPVVAFQLLSNILVDCINSQDAIHPFAVSLVTRNQEHDIEPKWKSLNWVLLRTLNVTHPFWENDKYLKVPEIDLSVLRSIFSDAFQALTKDDEAQTSAGVISLRESAENELKYKNSSGHALFFQCSRRFFPFS